MEYFLRVVICMSSLQYFYYCLADDITVVGAGSNFASDLIKAITTSYKATSLGHTVGINFDYASLDSLKGLCRIENYSTECQSSDNSNPQNLDFAISDVIPEQNVYENYQDLQMYPIVSC